MFIDEGETPRDYENWFSYANYWFKLIRLKFVLAEPAKLSQYTKQFAYEYLKSCNYVCLAAASCLSRHWI